MCAYTLHRIVINRTVITALQTRTNVLLCVGVSGNEISKCRHQCRGRKRMATFESAHRSACFCLDKKYYVLLVFRINSVIDRIKYNISKSLTWKLYTLIGYRFTLRSSIRKSSLQLSIYILNVNILFIF